MISGLRGVVAGKGADHVDIDVGGVVYRAHVSLTTLAAVPADGQVVRLHIQMAVRDDAITLYGFATDEERTIFVRLLAVQGVGPRVALSVLGVPTGRLARAVAEEDLAFLKRIPHVGPKTAGRIIIELKDRLGGAAAWAPPGGGNGAAAGLAGRRGELEAALSQLGYRPAEVQGALKALKGAIDGGEPLDDLVRRALSRLSGGVAGVGGPGGAGEAAG